MLQLLAIRRTISRTPSVSPSVVGFAAIVATWVLFRLAALEQAGYDPMRDTISSLASDGASSAWIGMLAIATAGFATIVASMPLRSLSQPAALALGVAGASLLTVALTRIACPDGAAGCAMGVDTDYSTATAHTVGIILFEVTLVSAIGCAALCLWRAGERLSASVAVIGMLLSIIFFAIAPMEIGMKQRLWLMVNTILIGGALLLPLHPAGRSDPSASG